MKTVKDKIYEKHPSFVDEVQALTVAQLKERIVAMQQGLEESEAHKEANEDLKNAKDAVSVIAGPYKDVKDAVILKTRFIIELIREKGGQ